MFNISSNSGLGQESASCSSGVEAGVSGHASGGGSGRPRNRHRPVYDGQRLFDVLQLEQWWRRLSVPFAAAASVRRSADILRAERRSCPGRRQIAAATTEERNSTASHQERQGQKLFYIVKDDHNKIYNNEKWLLGTCIDVITLFPVQFTNCSQCVSINKLNYIIIFE